MKITIIHPTRGRKQLAFETATKWVQKAFNPSNIEYLFSVDNNDPEWSDLPYGLERYWSIAWLLHKWNVISNANESAIGAINIAAKLASGNLIIVVSDDFDCPEQWDMLLLNLVEGAEDFIVKTQDGIQKTLITLPIMDRKYYERFGYIYHPEYKHMFSDQEMTAVGHMLGKVITLDLTFEHLHYTTGKSKKDAINLRNDSTWAQGEALFNERLKTNFGIQNPVIPYSAIKWK